MSRIYKLVVFVPDSHLEPLKQALFEAGAGKQGAYDQCSWQGKGEGQFRPLMGSNPYLGSENALEKVGEWRLEMLVEEQVVQAVVAALRSAHPYEEPAFDLLLRAQLDIKP